MSPKYVILATEGADDQAILCRLLKRMHFTSFNYTLNDIEGTFWNEFVPRFPQATCLHAHKNHSYPYIYLAGEYQVAVYEGEGDNLIQGLLDRMQNTPKYKEDIHALGLIIDADEQKPVEAATPYVDAFKSFFPAFPSTPGTVVPASPRLGISIWPDNQHSGTLETLLLECASFIYPDHKAGAERYVNELDVRYKQKWNNAKREKALIASIVSILRPGKANHISFNRHEDQWVSALTLEKVAALQNAWVFLHNLLDIDLTATPSALPES